MLAPGDRPVFVLGSPRSGTTILARALAKHPLLHAFPETDMLFGLFGDGRLERVFTQAQPGTFLRLEQVARAEFFEAAGSGFRQLLAKRSDGKRWIDHTPAYTLMAATLAELFPSARFLHIVRDGRWVVNSMMNFGTLRNAQGIKNQVDLPPWAEDFEAACRTWVEYLEAGMAFAEAHTEQCLTVTNERLSQNPDRQFEEIFQFLDVSSEVAAAEYTRGNRINSSYPPHYSSGGAQEQANPWDDWGPEQKRDFIRDAGETMLRCGYLTDQELAVLRDDATREVEAVSGHLLPSRVRAAVSQHIPPEAIALVMSTGDDELIQLEDRVGQHFPQSPEGTYAGYYPANDEEAIGHLEVLRTRGAEFLVIPEPALWWLDDYPQFRHHLETRYIRMTTADACTIFQL